MPWWYQCCDTQYLASTQESFLTFSPSSCLSPGKRKMFVLIALPPGLAPHSGAACLTWGFMWLVPIPQPPTAACPCGWLPPFGFFFFPSCSVSLMSSRQRPLSWLSPNVEDRCRSGSDSFWGSWDMRRALPQPPHGHWALAAFLSTRISGFCIPTCFNWLFRFLMHNNGSWKPCVGLMWGKRPRVFGWALREWEGTERNRASSLQGLWNKSHPRTTSPVTGDAFVSTCIEMHVVFFPDLQQEPHPCLELTGKEGSVLCSLEREISPDLGGINYFVC